MREGSAAVVGCLIKAQVRRFGGRLTLITLGLSLTFGIIFFIAGLCRELPRIVFNPLLNRIPVEEIMVVERGFSLPIPILRNFEFSGGRPLGSEIVGELRRDPAVGRVNVVTTLKLPSSISVRLGGLDYQSDVPVLAVDEEWGRELGLSDSTRVGDNIPIVVPRLVIDLYNRNFAPAQGLPRLSVESVIGRHVRLLLGVSSVSRAVGTRELRCQVAGTSNHPALMGIVISESRLAEILSKMGRGREQLKISLVRVIVSESSQVPRLINQLRKRGFGVIGSGEIIERVREGFRIITVGTIVFAGVLFLAGVTILVSWFSGIVEMQREDIKEMYYLGIPVSLLRKVYLLQAILVTGSSAALGTVVGTGLFYGMVSLISRYWPVEFEPISLVLRVVPVYLGICIICAGAAYWTILRGRAFRSLVNPH